MKTERIVLAGGCFWGVEDLLRKLPGVADTEVGYAGGARDTASYYFVKQGNTGHAEALEIEFNPEQITRAKILDFFFQMHDPTTLNRQGNDVGSQYRSTIFVESEEERQIAQQAISQQSGKWPRPVVTTIETLKGFYPAEQEHQDYLQKNPGGYTCHYWRGPGPG